MCLKINIFIFHVSATSYTLIWLSLSTKPCLHVRASHSSFSGMAISHQDRMHGPKYSQIFLSIMNGSGDRPHLSLPNSWNGSLVLEQILRPLKWEQAWIFAIKRVSLVTPTLKFSECKARFTFFRHCQCEL